MIAVTFACRHTNLIAPPTTPPQCSICGNTMIVRSTAPMPHFRGAVGQRKLKPLKAPVTVWEPDGTPGA